MLWGLWSNVFEEILIRKLTEKAIEPESQNKEGKDIYIININNNNYEYLKLVITAKNDGVLEKNPSCIIKYESENNAPEFDFNNELEIKNVDDKQGNKTEGENEHAVEIFIKPPALKSGDKITNIEYIAYICDTIISDVENLHPGFLKGKTGCNEVKVNNNKIELKKEEGKEYSIVVQANVQNGDNTEAFIYKTFIKNQTDKDKDKSKNDIIFYIMMGSFALVIIVVFIIISCIIRRNKMNNPDIDD
jgi:hypothetical protein